jgi:hypothetical protein
VNGRNGKELLEDFALEKNHNVELDCLINVQHDSEGSVKYAHSYDLQQVLIKYPRVGSCSPQCIANSESGVHW